MIHARDGWVPSRLGAGMDAGTADRSLDLAALTARWGSAPLAQATQVHGAGIAVVSTPPGAPVAGCDALLTATPGLLLIVRTADCVPVFIGDARQRVIGVAHAGWRGLAASLPARLVAAAQRFLHARPADLRAAIGPAIRACCYEVGPEFARSFGPYMHDRSGLPGRPAGRRTCDLVGVAIAQLHAAGVPSGAIEDSGVCTKCQARWYSTRREGQATGRLLSFIRLR